MNRVSIPAIAISSGIILACDMIGSSILYLALGDQGVPGINQNAGFLLAALVFGTATTVLGGFLAAHFAKKYPYFNAAVFGITGIVLGLLLSEEGPFWFEALGIVSTMPAAIWGGQLYRQNNPQKKL